MITKPVLIGAASVVVLCVLAACGGSNSDYGTATQTNPSTQAAPADAFTTSVQTTLASAPDDTESTSIDSVAVTSPEDSEPVAI